MRYQVRSWGLRLLVKLNISQAVSSGKDAIDEMKWEKIESLKERISSQQIPYIEALGKSLFPIDRIKTDRCNVHLPKVRPAGGSRCVPKNRVLRFL